MRIHIKAIKYIILVVALALLGVLLIYTQPQIDLLPAPSKDKVEISSEDKKIIEDFENASDIEKTEKTVDKTITQAPKYVGEDQNNKLWILEASKAIQEGGLSKGITNLFNVVANTLSQSDKKIDYYADKGRYIPEQDKVILEGNVRLESEDIKVKTEKLEYNLKTGYGETKTKVYITTDQGTLEGDSLQSYNKTEKFVLTGNVKAVLYRK